MRPTSPAARTHEYLLERASRISCILWLGPLDDPCAKEHPVFRAMAESSLLKSTRVLLAEALIEELLARAGLVAINATRPETTGRAAVDGRLSQEIAAISPKNVDLFEEIARGAAVRAMRRDRRHADDEMAPEEP